MSEGPEDPTEWDPTLLPYNVMTETPSFRNVLNSSTLDHLRNSYHVRDVTAT